MFLTPDEIIELTGKKRCSAQTRALNAMGIEYRLRPDGGIVISRSHVEKALGGLEGGRAKIRTEPNWSAI